MLVCNICKHRNKLETEYPCSVCVHACVDKYEPMTNHEVIQSMSVSELADFICDIYASNEHHEIRVDGKWMLPEDVEEWLKRARGVD